MIKLFSSYFLPLIPRTTQLVEPLWVTSRSSSFDTRKCISVPRQWEANQWPLQKLG
eukprot:CAMPEP_0178996048 /NCGR_PEP_ID=MMETSP0795-20121207/8156_1 /TAXON_ID=88552 /ORGANISM="Amoebophrya sp., Strain Ameob2" /LENGTH=55 /DNA_ID=CAMNT_0020688403 /DNA_START=330 /DNA_END=493 /DNA_ORIENTATION=-